MSKISDSFRYSSTSQATTQAATATNLTLAELLRYGPGALLSLFGYNAGVEQFLQLFDAVNVASITNAVEGATSNVLTIASHPLKSGDRIWSASTTGLTDGAYWVHYISVDTLSLHTTYAEGMSGANKVTVTNGATGTLNLMPIHTFKMGATDNFSVIVPDTGIGFGRGLVVCVSSTDAYLTAGTESVTICATLKS